MENKDTEFLCCAYFDIPAQMKKQILMLLLGIIFIIPARAQLKSELNQPRSGEVIIKQQVEYKNPGRTGENVLWDFGKLQAINEEYELSYFEPDLIDNSMYIIGLDTILLKNLTEGSLLIGTEHNTMYYYYLTGNRLWVLGHENPTTLLQYTEPLLAGMYPMQYKDSCSSDYRSKGLYSSTVPFTSDGRSQIQADAHGMMILPSGDTLQNVLRTSSTQTVRQVFRSLNGTVQEFNSLVKNYKWYSEGYRYPIFETIQTSVIEDGKEDVNFETAFFFPPQEHYYLETDPENKTIVESKKNGKKDDPLKGSKFNAFPNPMTTALNVEVFIPAEAKIKIQVRSVAHSKVYINENKGKFSKGTHHFQFDVSKLPFGYYLVSIWADNYLLSETMLKN